MNLILTDIKTDKISKGEDIVINDDLANLIASYDEVTSAIVKGSIIEAVVDSYIFEVTSDLVAENKEEIAVVEPDNIEDWVYTINEEENTVTIQGYRGDDTEIVIPNYINGIPVKRIEATEDQGGGNSQYSAAKNYTFWDINDCQSTGYGWVNDKIKKITVSEGIEELGYLTFYGTRQVNEIILPTTLTKIEQGAFARIQPDTQCVINIPSNVTEVNNVIGGFGESQIFSKNLVFNFEQNQVPESWISNWLYELNDENYNITINFGVK